MKVHVDECRKKILLVECKTFRLTKEFKSYENQSVLYCGDTFQRTKVPCFIYTIDL